MANTKPTANSDFNTIYFNDLDGAVSGNILANDTDADGDQLFLRFLDGARVGTPGSKGGATDTVQGQYGTFTIHSDGSYVYTLDHSNPAVIALGAGGPGLVEKVSYKIIDSAGNTDFDYLTIDIKGSNAKPEAVDDFASVSGTTATGNVLLNDTDDGTIEVARAGGENGATPNPNDFLLKFVGSNATTTVQGKYGSLEIDHLGNFTYTLDTSDPDTIALGGAVAEDTFQYRIRDDAFGGPANSNTTDIGLIHIAINDLVI